MSERLGDRFAPPLHLPPREVWLFSPGEDERLPTPVDERGLVDIEKLITIVKATVDPSFTWKPSDSPDKHHLYWRHSNYPDMPGAAVNPRKFCNLAVNKVLIPRLFHNWVHLVTEEPPIPGEETMHYRIEAQRVALELFSSARESKRLTRIKQLSDAELEERLTRQFEDFSVHLEEAKAIPDEFQIIDLSEFRLTSAEDMQMISHRIGELAVRKTTSRVRDVLRPLAA